MIHKYYKQNFHNIPRLKKYDTIIWIDGTIEIIHPFFVEYMVFLLKDRVIINFEHEGRKGKIEEEAYGYPNDKRYNSTYWLGQNQTKQDLIGQYEAYISDSYSNNYWKKIKNTMYYGFWILCVFAVNMNNNITTEFLDMWFLQTLKYTINDQLGFAYTCQKLKINPYSFPDELIVKYKNHKENELYKKYNHHN